MVIESSSISNAEASYGGAIYISETEANKDYTDSSTKFNITQTTFTTGSALVGGFLYLDNPHRTLIDSCTFTSGQAQNYTGSSSEVSVFGQGGALYYTCDDTAK